MQNLLVTASQERSRASGKGCSVSRRVVAAASLAGRIGELAMPPFAATPVAIFQPRDAYLTPLANPSRKHASTAIPASSRAFQVRVNPFTGVWENGGIWADILFN